MLINKETMKAKILKLISMVVAFSFFLNSSCFAVPDNYMGSAKPQLVDFPLGNTINNIFIPESYGTIEDSLTLSQEKHVVIIKDAHCNYEAQTNISKILDILIKDYKIDLVCVEGAEGRVDTKPFSAFPDKEAKDKVTDKYIKKGLLTASEALSISKGDKQPFTIWGVEDSLVYLEDFKAFRETLMDNADNIRLADQLIQAAGVLKDRIYNPRLLEFDRKYREYEENKIKLSDWMVYLRSWIMGLGPYKNIALVVKSIKLEEEIDFKGVERERTSLIKELEKLLPKEELKELVKKSLLFRLGKISSASYYTYLREITPDSFQGSNLNKYTRLVKIQSLIDSDELFKELSSLESSIYAKLCRTELERKLHKIDINLVALNKLFHLQMSREDLDYYKAHINEFDLKKIKDFINIQCRSRGIALADISTHGRLSLQSAERFYELALKRDQVLVDNLLKKLEADKKQRAAMVIGGFHAEGIIRKLEEEGISYTVVSPRITELQEDNPYLSIMLNDQIDIDKMIEDISATTLSTYLLFGNIGSLDPGLAQEARGRLARDLIAYRKVPLAKLVEKYTLENIEGYMLKELCQIADISDEEIGKILKRETKIEEIEKLKQFLEPDALADRIIAEQNTAYASFLLELLKEQREENPGQVNAALEKVFQKDTAHIEEEIAGEKIDIVLEDAIDRLPEGDRQRLLLEAVLEYAKRNPDLIESEESFEEGREIIKEGFVSQEALVKEEEHLKYVYILIDGELEVYQHGQEKPLAKIDKPGLFGEMMVLMGKRTASVKGAKSGEMLKITKDKFLELLQDPQFVVEYAKLVRERERQQKVATHEIKLGDEAHMESMQVPEGMKEDHYEKEGLRVADSTGGETQLTDSEIEGLMEEAQTQAEGKGGGETFSLDVEGVPVEFTVVLEGGRQFCVQTDILKIEAFRDRLRSALKQKELREGLEISPYKGPFLIGLLERSPRLFEDHVGNGFIGINKAFLEMYEGTKEKDKKNFLEILLQLGLEHELMHELYVAGPEIEDELRERDIWRIREELGEDLFDFMDYLSTSGIGIVDSDFRDTVVRINTHRAGQPRVIGYDAHVEDSDHIVKYWPRRDEVGDWVHFSRAIQEIRNNMGRIKERFSKNKSTIIGYYWRLKERLEEVQSGLLLKPLQEEERKSLKNEEELLKQKMDLLYELRNHPEDVLEGLLDTLSAVILENMDFLIFNDRNNYRVGHYSREFNEVYLPEGVFSGICDSPGAVAAYLLGELVDSIIGEHTELSDELICIIDTEGRLVSSVNDLAETNYKRATELAIEFTGGLIEIVPEDESVSKERLLDLLIGYIAEENYKEADRLVESSNIVVNEDNMMEVISELEEIVGRKQISRSTLICALNLMLSVLERIDARSSKKFTVAILGSKDLCDILSRLVKPREGGSGEIPTSNTEESVRRLLSVMWHSEIISEYEWYGYLDYIESQIAEGRSVDELVEFIDRSLEAIDGERIKKRCLGMLLCELTEEQCAQVDFVRFVYSVLALPSVREIYSEEYLGLVVEITAKIEEVNLREIESGLRDNNYIPLQQFLGEYSDHFEDFELSGDDVRGYFENILQNRLKNVVVDPDYPEEKIREAGFSGREEFEDEVIRVLSNEEILIERLRSIDRSISREDLRGAEIYIKPIAVTLHTCVSLIRVKIKGEIHLFVMKGSFDYFNIAIGSDVAGLCQTKRDASIPVDQVIARQFGECITPFTRGKRLMGYYRLEEYIPGVNLHEFKQRLDRIHGENNGRNTDEYKIAEALNIAMYYILFNDIAEMEWFITDATDVNVMLSSIADGFIAGRVVDVEARIELPNGFRDENFENLLFYRGFSRSQARIGIRLAKDIYDWSTGGFDLSRIDQDYQESIVKAIDVGEDEVSYLNQDAADSLNCLLQDITSRKLQMASEDRVQDVLTQESMSEQMTGRNTQPQELTDSDEPAVLTRRERQAGKVEASAPIEEEGWTIEDLGDLYEEYDDKGRFVAKGDVHGNLGGLKKNLLKAGLINRKGEWIGKGEVFIQLGDIVDGPYSIETLEYLLKLQKGLQARNKERERNGKPKSGKIVLLLGNHELAYLMGEVISGMKRVEVGERLKKGEKVPTDEIREAIAEYETIKDLLEESVKNGLIRAMHTRGNTAFMHGMFRRIIYLRLRNEVVKRKGRDDVSLRDIADYCNSLLVEAVATGEFSHYIFNKGRVSKDEYGMTEDAGIFWARPLGDDEMLPPGIRVVCAHTAQKRIRVVGSEKGAVLTDVGDRGYIVLEDIGDVTRIRAVERHAGFLWIPRELAQTRVPQKGLVNFEELSVGEDVAYDGTKVRGKLFVRGVEGLEAEEDEVKRARMIKDHIQIQKDSRPVKSDLGLDGKVWDRTEEDRELNDLLEDNLEELLEGLPREESEKLLGTFPKGLVFAILDQSYHFGENCRGDGFVGVNRYLLVKLRDAKEKDEIDALSNLLQVILYHELRHEALVYEREVLREKFRDRFKDLSSREQVLDALEGLSPVYYRAVMGEVEFRQNLRDIELLDSQGVDILIKLKLLRPDSYFTASVKYPERREGLKELSKRLYDAHESRVDTEWSRASEASVSARDISKELDLVVGDIAEILERHGLEFDDARRERLKEIIMKAYRGEDRIDLSKLMEMLAGKIEPKKIFQLAAEIAEPLNRFLGADAPTKGGRIVAAVLQEIWKLIPEEKRKRGITAEERLINTVQAIAEEKGIDPNAIWSVLDLFKAGVEILRLDPDAKIDANYIELVELIEKLTGIDDKKIIEAFTDRGLLNERAEPVANSPLAQEVQKLEKYLELNNIRTRGDLDLEYGLSREEKDLFDLGNLRAKVEKGENGDIQFLSGWDAVSKNLSDAYGEVRGSPTGHLVDRRDKVALVISADAIIDYERDGKIVKFSYRPGIQALLKTVANSENIHIAIRASGMVEEIIERAGILNKQVTLMDADRDLDKIRDDLDLSEKAEDGDHIAFILTPEEGEKNREIIESNRLKAFGLDKESAFHAALLFGLVYAQAQGIDEIKTAINCLKILGMKDLEVEEILRQIGEGKTLTFFVIELIRIEDTLERLQNCRLYIEVAA